MNASTRNKQSNHQPYPDHVNRRTRRWHSETWPRVAILGSLLFMVGNFLALGCGGEGDKVQALLSEPQEKTFHKGLITIKARINPNTRVKRASIVLVRMEQDAVQKELIRQDNPPTNWDYDWDTTKEKDGPYIIELQVLLENGGVLQNKVEHVWVVNQPADLQIKECTQPPLVTRGKIQLNLDWKNVPQEVPPSTVELFVQGQSAGQKSQPPYQFDLDLSKNQDGEELYINVIATRGVYRGSTSICSIRIDRKGPLVKFLYPKNNGDTVPAKFLAAVEVEEAFGIQEVRVLVGDKEVGKLQHPPFQIPVDLSKEPHGSVVKLKVLATDRAGNESEKPHELEVKVDAESPTVRIDYPEEKKNYLGDAPFEIVLQDASGLGVLDLYIVDEQGKRVDNVLHRDGQGITKEVTLSGKIFSPLVRYGAGTRKLEVVARDVHGNVTTMVRQFVVGCVTPSDCPTSSDPNNPFLCLENRCVIPRQEGEQCTQSSSCKPPLICHFGGLSYCAKEKIGICRKPCQPNRGDCAGGEFCLTHEKNGNVCFPGDPCDPFTYNCSKTEQCNPWGSDSFICLPIGFAREGEPCTAYACDGTLNCGKGLACVPGTNDKGLCHRLCDVEFPLRDCTSQENCVAFPLRDRTVNSIGYCKPVSP